jgi:hypothetical protein
MAMRLAAATGLLAVCAGCWTLPSGNPPEGPIVAPQASAPAAMASGAAVDYMATSLATRCPEIFAAAVPPGVTNAFQVADREVNSLPMEVWQGLIRMRLIRPVPPDDPDAAYRLESVTLRDPLAEATPGMVPYRWRMRLLALTGEARECWQEEILVAVPELPVPDDPVP